MKETIHALLTVSTKTVEVQTDISSADIDVELSGMDIFHNKYQDLYPSFAKIDNSSKPNAHLPEYDFHPATLERVLADCGLLFPDVDSLVASQTSPNKDSSQTDGKKSKFDWGFFKKFGSEKKEEQGRGKATEEGTTRERELVWSRGVAFELVNRQNEGYLKRLKQWEREVTGPVANREHVMRFTSKMYSFIKAGNGIPVGHRGVLWRRLVGNRSRLNRRIFSMLLSQLSQCNQQVRERIVKDLDAAFPAFGHGEVFEGVKAECVKVLQLFEVETRDAEVPPGRGLHLEHELHRAGSPADDEHLPHFQSLCEPDPARRGALHQPHDGHEQSGIFLRR